MIVKKIKYSKKFVKELNRLDYEIVKLAAQKEKLFKQNPLHPSLRLHELHGNLTGLWSISITKNYRLIFLRNDEGEIIFISIGKHDIYGNL